MSFKVNEKYIVVPSVTTIERNALTPAKGMLVYDTTLNAFYKYENGAWSAFGGGAVSSVFGRTGAVVAQSGDYSKSDVGLANVDNTSDANKPVSTATQTALDLKQNKSIMLKLSGDVTTTSNVSSAITGLVATLEANTNYIITGVLRSRCSGTGGVKYGMTLVSGGTSAISAQGKGAVTGSVSYLEEYFFTQTGALTATGVIRIAGGASDIYLNGNINVGATAGDIQFNFASGTNTQTSTIDQFGTWIEIKKVV
jgi:hypothetical protein